VKLRYNDGETLEGVVPNDLLSLLDNGLQITSPDLNSSTDRIFVPRAALSELDRSRGGRYGAPQAGRCLCFTAPPFSTNRLRAQLYLPLWPVRDSQTASEELSP